jgi:hypothetical protein
MLYAQNLLDLLNRKHKFVKESTDDIYLLECKKFIEFLLNSDYFKDYIFLIYNAWNEERKQYEDYLAKAIRKIAKLKNKIIKKYPHLNDNKLQRPRNGFVRGKYRYSFAYFNDILKGERQKSFSMNPQLYDDNTDVRLLINIINSKINEYEKPSVTSKGRELDKNIWVEFQTIVDNHNYKHKDFVNFRRVSPGASLIALLQITQVINPKPKAYSSKDEFYNNLVDFEEFELSFLTEDIIKAVYEYNRYQSDFSDDPNMAAFKERRRRCEVHLRRIYETLREKIGTHLSHLQLINKYKTRCMWYDYTRMRDLVNSDSRENVSHREHRLTVDLARYLFDNGVTSLYRAKFGIHEVDLVDPSSKSPIFVEAKAYVSSEGTRKRLIDGIAQVHSYLNNITSKYMIEEAYYVIFRLGGPLYDLPSKINFHRYIIIPIIIDLGASRISGSQQPKPITINLDEITSSVGDMR